MFETEKLKVEAARAKYLEIVNTAPAAEVREASQAVKEAQAVLAAAIVEGAAPCSGPCGGATPHGMEQEYVVKNQPKVGFEIGCTLCKDHRVFGATHAECVEAWNTQQYINPAKAEAFAAEQAAAQ